MRAFVAAVRSAGEGASERARPAVRGRFGPYGGRYVPETLMAALDELEAAVAKIVPSEAFQRELAGAALGVRRAGRRRSIARAA